MRITYKLGRRRVMIRVAMFTCVLLAVTLAGRSCIAIFGEVEKGYQARDRLLCQTDYQVLLDACRDLLERQEPGVYLVGDRPQSPVVLQFPRPILELAPESIRISHDGHMVIEMFGNGMYHCGAFTYPQRYEKANRGSTLGNRMLVEGLWYYDDQYNDDPGYGKVIDKLIEKGKKGHSELKGSRTNGMKTGAVSQTSKSTEWS
jgi:hypothetical protein